MIGYMNGWRRKNDGVWGGRVYEGMVWGVGWNLFEWIVDGMVNGRNEVVGFFDELGLGWEILVGEVWGLFLFG